MRFLQTITVQIKSNRIVDLDNSNFNPHSIVSHENSISLSKFNVSYSYAFISCIISSIFEWVMLVILHAIQSLVFTKSGYLQAQNHATAAPPTIVCK